MITSPRRIRESDRKHRQNLMNATENLVAIYSNELAVRAGTDAREFESTRSCEQSILTRMEIRRAPNRHTAEQLLADEECPAGEDPNQNS